MVRSAGTARPGHSLPELIVALAFLGATLGVVGSSAVLGARQVAHAALRHEAIREAAAALDSLAAVPAPAAGSRTTPRLRIAWAPVRRLRGPGIRVTAASRADGRLLATLIGAVPPALDTLPAPRLPGPASVP